MGMRSKVYFSQLRDGERLDKVSEKVRRLFVASQLLDLVRKDDFVGIKLHFGEEGNTGYIKPEWVKVVIDEVRRRTKEVFVTDTNTLYRGQRSNSIDHLRLAHLHGFSIDSLGAPVIIADGLLDSSYKEVVIEKKHFKSVKIARAIVDCDVIFSLAHLTGHMLTGIGGALKNLGMGCASRAGKLEQHSRVVPEVNPTKCTGCGRCVGRCPVNAISIINEKAKISRGDCIGCGECISVCRPEAIKVRWNESTHNLQEKMAEYAFGAIKAVDGRVGFMNFLIKVTKDCDCMAKDDPAIVADVGILTSRDPVAIDKASCDLVNKVGGKDKFREGYPEVNWQVQLEHAARIGMGTLEYDLVEVK